MSANISNEATATVEEAPTGDPSREVLTQADGSSLPELPDDRSWAAPVDPVSRGWKIASGCLVGLLLVTGGAALGARFHKSSSSSTGQFPGGGGFANRGQRTGDAGAFGGGNSGILGANAQGATATTTIAPIEGQITEIDPDILTVRDDKGEEVTLAIDDATLISRVRAVASDVLTVGQRVRVEPTDSDRIRAKQITVLSTK